MTRAVDISLIQSREPGAARRTHSGASAPRFNWNTMSVSGRMECSALAMAAGLSEKAAPLKLENTTLLQSIPPRACAHCIYPPSIRVRAADSALYSGAIRFTDLRFIISPALRSNWGLPW